MSQKIVYVGNFSFPYGNASGSRVLGNGYMLRELGYEVVFIGLDNRLPANSDLKETEQTFEGFTYYNLPYPAGMKGWLSYQQRFNEVIALLGPNDLFAIIGYGSPTLSLFGNLVRKWCKKNSVLYLTDVVDWMASGVGSILHRTIKFLDNDYQKRILNSKADGAITISSYLSNFYQKKGLRTVIIPPLVDVNRYKLLDSECKPDSTINLIYVGRPFATDGRKVKESSYKDRLDIVIDALLKIPESNFVFDIYGLTKDEYLSVIFEHRQPLEAVGDKVRFHGAIKNEEGIKKIAKADFTILLRDVKKLTTAGFPTKFPETISCGTPIITTDTSDLAQYIETGKNGFFVSIKDRENLPNQLSGILAYNKNQVQDMKNYCKESDLFSYHNYKDKMKQFLTDL